MLRIKLLNMPFASLHLPSIALTQLKAALDRRLAREVTTTIHYLNHECGRHVGLTLYKELAQAHRHQVSALGEWLFSQAAFPGRPDTEDEYLSRYYPGRAQAKFRERVASLRRGLPAVLDTIISEHELTTADVVGFTSMFQQTVPSLALARRVKELAPATVVVMGGANCEHPMGRELVLRAKDLDFVFSGPSLVSFPDFVEALLRDDRTSVHEIEGVFSRLNRDRSTPLSPTDCDTADRERFEVGPVGRELEIDTELDLDYDHFLNSLSLHAPEEEPSLLFETSRGCWWGQRAHCTFCGLNGQTIAHRAMTADRAVSLIESLFRYSDRCTRLEAVDNILPRHYVQEVLPRLRTPEDITLFYEVRADLSPDEVAVLANAGVRQVQPGIEALHTPTLKLMRKGTSAFQNLRFLQSCRRFDVTPTWNLLVGFPDEEPGVFDHYEQLLPKLHHLYPPTGAYPIRFDRYSPYFEEPERWGLRLEPLDYYGYVFPYSAPSLERLAYFFRDSTPGPAYALVMVERIGRLRQLIDDWQGRWLGGGQPPSLTLERTATGGTVVDTRGQTPEVTDVPPQAVALLHQLWRARKVSDPIVRRLGGAIWAGRPVLTQLRERGLLFEERGRLQSLVLVSGESAVETDSTNVAQPLARMSGSQSVSRGRSLPVLTQGTGGSDE